MIENMNLVFDWNFGGNEAIDGGDNLRSAHVLAHFFFFVNEQDTRMRAMRGLPGCM